MQIAGIQKFSLIDFPGKIATVIFTFWCNFRCSYCHNPEFVSEEFSKNILENSIPEEVFFHFLEKRKGLLDGVSICWWEPTIQKDLSDFCKKVKELWFFVKIDTNGANPKILKSLIADNLVDYIAMDIKNPLEKYTEITWANVKVELLKESIEIIKDSSLEYEFRTTCVAGIHNEENIESIAKTLAGAKLYYLQNFKPWNTLQKDFSGKSFTKEELENFQTLAQKYVEKCLIRM